MKELKILFAKLERVIKVKGQAKVFYALGYQSKEAYKYWKRLGHVPRLAQIKVEKYLEEIANESK